MKLKITDLMDLYEDRQAEGRLEPQAQSRSALDGEETIPLKVTKHLYTWKQGLALAAVLAVAVLAGFAVKGLLGRSQPTAAESGTVPVVTQEPLPEGWTPLAGDEQETVSRLLTCFAQQSIYQVPGDLDSDGALIHFAFVYRRNYDCESITVMIRSEEPTDTLTPEQVNETLEALLGRSVEVPTRAENASPEDVLLVDYSAQAGLEPGSLEFEGGRFWDLPGEKDTSVQFALATGGSPDRSEVRFEVYAVNLLLWPDANLDTLPALSTQEAEALVREEKLLHLRTGTAALEPLGDGFRLKTCETAPVSDVEPEPTEPSQTDPTPAEDWQEMNRLLTALAQQGITDLTADLGDEYDLISFAHIYTKIYDREALVYQTVEGDSYETLTLEQVNGVLERFFGCSFFPEDGTDYTARRGDNYAVHERFMNGRFWWPAADGEIRTRFAVAYSFPAQGEEAWETRFEVYEIDLDQWPEFADLDPADYGDLNAIMAINDDMDLTAIGVGTAAFERTALGLRITAFHYDAEPQTETPDDPDLTPVDPETEAAVRALFDDPAGWYSRALTSEYEDALHIDLGQLFYAGIPGADNTLSDAEKAALADALGEYYADLMRLDCFKVSAQAANEVLEQLFETNIYSVWSTRDGGLETIFGDGWWYLYLNHVFDGWYGFHGDTNLRPIEIETVWQAEGGYICVDYRFRDSGSEALNTVVLKRRDGRYQILANLGPAARSSLFTDATLALKEELRLLFSNESGWYARALSSSYADPADVDLAMLFYDGFPDGELTDAEKLALYGTTDPEEMYGPPTDRLTRANMDAVLTQYFGLTLEQTSKNGLDSFQYLPETDCWYHCHGDTNMSPCHIREVRREANGAVLFTYTNGLLPMLPRDETYTVFTAVLAPDGAGGYRFLSNLPGEWVTAESLGNLGTLYGGKKVLRAETTAANGTRTVRELDLNRHNGLFYKEGDPDSEYSYWMNGSWRLKDGGTFQCWMFPCEESGNRAGESVSADYACSLSGNKLTLTQISEQGFGDDPKGTVLVFEFKGTVRVFEIVDE